MGILITDSNTKRYRQLRTILGTLGYKSGDIAYASSLESASSLLLKRRFDCCFVAMSAPGLSFITEGRARETTKGIPIIVFGSEGTKDNVTAAKEAGADGFLLYPFTTLTVESVLALTFHIRIR